MASTLLLFAGSPKSGTSSFQHLLFFKGSSLPRFGYFAPTDFLVSDQTPGPSALLSYVCTRFARDDLHSLRRLLYHGRPWLKSLEAGEHFKSLVRDVALQSNEKVCVLSDELLLDVVAEDWHFRRLQEYILSCFDNVKIVLFLRPQLERALSQLTTSVLGGSHQSFLVQPEKLSFSYKYSEVVPRWVRFACDHGHSIATKIFNSSSYPDVLADLLPGVPRAFLRDNLPHLNSSISSIALRSIASFNARVDRSLIWGTPSHAIASHIPSAVAYALRSFPKLKPSAGDVEAYNVAFAKANLELSEKFLDGTPLPVFDLSRGVADDLCESDMHAEFVDGVANILWDLYWRFDAGQFSPALEK